jgi:predicted nuclease of predicted toxin-antitoxin system
VKFLLDGNMPRAASRALAAHGHQTEHLRDTSLRDADDERVFAHACASGAVLVSRDLDFADTRRYPPAQHRGLIVLRMGDDSSASQIADVLGRFAASASLLDQLPGHLVILEPSRVRFRPALP